MRRIPLVTAWVLPSLYLLLFAAPSVRLPGDHLGIRRFQTPPLGADISVGQTFTMESNGLYGIELFPVAVGEPSGGVRFELHDVREKLTMLIRTLDVPADEFAGAGSYRFEFAPIPDSWNRRYRVDLVGSPASGVALWATKGERYDGGSMHINGRDRWSDLEFQALAPAPSVWRRVLDLRHANPARSSLVILAVLGISVSLWRVLRHLSNVHRL